MTDQTEIIRRGERAQQIVNDEAFKQAIADLHELAFHKARALDANPKNDENRYRAMLFADAVDAVVSALEGYMAEGKAAAELADEDFVEPRKVRTDFKGFLGRN